MDYQSLDQVRMNDFELLNALQKSIVCQKSTDKNLQVLLKVTEMKAKLLACEFSSLEARLHAQEKLIESLLTGISKAFEVKTPIDFMDAIAASIISYAQSHERYLIQSGHSQETLKTLSSIQSRIDTIKTLES